MKIETSRLPDFRSKFDRIVRRSKANSLPLPTYAMGKEQTDPVRGKTYVEITFNFPQVQLPGYQVLGMAEYLDENPKVYSFGETDVLKTFPRERLDRVCDHCGHNRKRKRIFLVHKDEGDQLLRLGSSCVELAEGISLARACQSYEKLIDRIGRFEDEDWSFAPGAFPCTSDYVLAVAVFHHLTTNAPFVSLRQVRESGDPTLKSTASSITEIIEGRYAQDHPAPIAQGFIDEARKSIDYALQKDATHSDFWHNIQAILKNGICREEEVKYLAPVYNSYLRGNGDHEPDTPQPQPQAPAADYFGTVDPSGEKQVAIVNFERVLYEGESIYGPFRVLLFKTDAGHSLIYKTSGSLDRWTDYHGPLWFHVMEHKDYVREHHGREYHNPETVIAHPSKTKPKCRNGGN